MNSKSKMELPKTEAGESPSCSNNNQLNIEVKPLISSENFQGMKTISKGKLPQTLDLR